MTGLFGSAIPQEDRIKAVIKMMGHHESEFESEVMRHFVGELLSKAEKTADNWLRHEISECMRGEAARRILRRNSR